MVPKISAQLLSQSLLIGTFVLISIGNAIASEIPIENLNIEKRTNSVGVIAKTQPSFSDVSGHWAQVYIEALASRGFLAGYPGNTKYYPDRPVTRTEFAAIVSKAFKPLSKRKGEEFLDVLKSDWGYQVIQNTYRGNFLDGYPGNVFQPNQHIPRVQALVSLTAGLDLKPQDRKILSFYQDADTIPDFAVNATVATTEQQIVVNSPNLNLLHPNREATRAEVAAFIHQALVKTGAISPINPTPNTVVVIPTSSPTGSNSSGKPPASGASTTPTTPGIATVINNPPTKEKPPIHLVVDSPEFTIPVDPLDVYTPNPNLTPPSKQNTSSSQGEYVVDNEPPANQWQTFLNDQPSSKIVAFQPIEANTGVTNPNTNPPVPVDDRTWTTEKLNKNNVPVAGNNQPGAVITGVRVEHNIPLDQYTKGMAITVSSRIWNASGQKGSVNIYLKKGDGQYVNSSNPSYTVPGKGFIVAGQSIKIPSSQNNLTELKTVLYLPYSAIDLPSGRHQNLILQSQIQLPVALANDEKYQLDLNISSSAIAPAGQFFIPETNSSSPGGSLPQAEAYLINGFFGCCTPNKVYQVLTAPKGQDTGIFKTPERPNGFKGLGIPTAVGNWDDLYSEKVGLTVRTDNKFRSQMRTRLRQGNPNVPLILIGHSFGADSLLQVAQCEAGNDSACPPNHISLGRVEGRKVLFLGVIDGVEFGGKRTRRTVPNNVDYLFNRWTDEPSRAGAAAGGAAGGFGVAGPGGALIAGVVAGTAGIPVNSGANGKLRCEAKQCEDQDKQGIAREWDNKPKTNKCDWFELTCREKQKRVDHGGLPSDERVQYQMLEALTKLLATPTLSLDGTNPPRNTKPQGNAYLPPDITLNVNLRLQTCNAGKFSGINVPPRVASISLDKKIDLGLSKVENRQISYSLSQRPSEECYIRKVNEGLFIIDISRDALRNYLNLPKGTSISFLSFTGVNGFRGDDIMLNYPTYITERTVANSKFTILVKPQGGTPYEVERTIFVTRQD
jgi:hypothetical protein